MAVKKSKGVGTVAQRRQLLDKEGNVPSRKRQCDLLGLTRSTTYYKKRESKESPEIKEAIEKLYEEDATLGRRRMPVMLQRRYGIKISQKKCARLKKKLGLRTLYPHRNTSAPNPRAEKKGYLLKDIEIKRIDQVWTSDITYIQIEQKNYYLCVILDWDSRYVLGWSMGRNMDVGLCLKALEMALGSGCRPGIFNTDQGSQYTSEEWQSAILSEGIQISMDGKGRWADNIIMERFWRTYKHEFFLHREPRNLEEAIIMTAEWLEYYNKERPHSSLDYLSPQMYRDEAATPLAANFWRDFSAPAQLAALRAAPSLRSGRNAYATKSRQKWIDIREYRMI